MATLKIIHQHRMSEHGQARKKCVRNASEIFQPRDALHKVIAEDLGGIATCASVGQIPRGRQQVKDLRKKAE